MIGIITYVSVLERTQEIGILRAVGARKKDIKRVFNSETFLIGLTSGVMGSIISFILTFPLNKIIHNLEKTMVNALRMNLIHVLAMIVVSVFLTFIAGLIPSAVAAKKHPVEALRHNE
jgi:putative ABC transport system permease protein